MKKQLAKIALALICSFSTPTFAQPPLPADIIISEPDARLGKEIGVFSGKWVGKWDGALDAILIVEKIENDGAKVLYAWGDAPQWNIKAGYRRYEARVQAGNTPFLEFSTPSGALFTIEYDNHTSSLRVIRIGPNGTDVKSFRRN